nr:MAG TPA: hypothetical protein [Caudoviricetes sp.]
MKHLTIEKCSTVKRNIIRISIVITNFESHGFPVLSMVPGERSGAWKN